MTPTDAPAPAPDHRRRLGRLGEELAAEHLARLGLTIVDRNFRTRWGELDIVACDARHLVFCEVKTRRSGGQALDPLESVHPRKRVQVRRMAGQWLAQPRERPRLAEVRFDVIGVVLDRGDRLVRLDHLEAAF